MPRKPNRDAENALAAFQVFRQLPLLWQAVIVSVVIVAGLVYLLVKTPHPPGLPGTGATPSTSDTRTSPLPTPPTTGPVAVGNYLFCFWNVENLFDDMNDHRRPADEAYDDPFANDVHLRQLKYDHIVSTLLRMNGSKGPDMIGCVEMESVRAGELLRDALNAKLTDPALHYIHLEMRDLDAGRHIAPCLITRLPVDSARTRLRGSKVRILETHLAANGADLCAVISHWTSQLTDKGEGDDPNTGRGKYASTIHEMFADTVRANPAADFLVCGDFNDTPDAEPVVKLLRATGDRSGVLSRSDPTALLDLMADKPPEKFGTLWYRGKPLIYDHICVSAGMLDDRGWSCNPDSVRAVTDGLIRPGSTRREPWRFGNPEPAMKDVQRGYSDHFPVTVELRVAPPAP